MKFRLTPLNFFSAFFLLAAVYVWIKGAAIVGMHVQQLGATIGWIFLLFAATGMSEKQRDEKVKDQLHEEREARRLCEGSSVRASSSLPLLFPVSVVLPARNALPHRISMDGRSIDISAAFTTLCLNVYLPNNSRVYYR